MVNYRKVYVAVTLYVNTEGKARPVALDWEDGRRFRIGKIVSVRNAPPEHVGAILTRRYDCVIGGRTRTLYLETYANRWFVEKPEYR